MYKRQGLEEVFKVLGYLEMKLGNFIEVLSNLEMELGNLDDLMVGIGNLVALGKDYVELKGSFLLVKAFQNKD